MAQTTIYYHDRIFVSAFEKKCNERTELLRIGSFTMQPALTKDRKTKSLKKIRKIRTNVKYIKLHIFKSKNILLISFPPENCATLNVVYFFFRFRLSTHLPKRVLKHFYKTQYTHTKHINRWKKFPNERKKTAIVFVIRRKLSSIWNQLNNNVW